MDGNGMDAEAGRIDVVSCGIGFPEDAETLGLIGRADVVYGSRALLAACPVEARLTRIIGAKAVRMRRTPSPCAGPGGISWYWPREMRCTTGSAVRFPAWPTPMTLLCIIPALPLFRRCFTGSACRGRTPALFSAHSGEALPARAIAEAPLSVAYAGSRYPAHAIAQAVLKLHPASAGRSGRHRRTARLRRRTPLFRPAGGSGPHGMRPHVHPASAPEPLALCPSYRRPDCSRYASRFRHSRRFPHIPQHPRADTHPWAPGRRL